MCGTNDATISWNIYSAVPLNYSVAAVSLAENISSVLCQTSSGSCRLIGLQCGETYNVSVKASSGSCSGQFSPPQTVETGNKDVDDIRMIISTKCVLLHSFTSSTVIFLQHPALLRV